MPEARTMQAPYRWPLASHLQTRTSALPLSKDQRLVNCYAEFDPDSKEYWIYKRFGLSPQPLFTGAGIGKGIYTDPYLGFALHVSGGTVFDTRSPSFGFTFTDTTNGAPFFFESINSNPRSIVLSNGLVAWVYQANSAVTQITDPNFPPNNTSGPTLPAIVPGWVYIDGTLYVMDFSGGIWGTAGLDNALVWSGLNLVKASSNADAGVALAKQLNYLVAFKQYTTQIFYDAGNAAPGSPLSPVPDSQVPFGCLGAYTVQEIDNSLLWVTSNKTVSPQVAQMDNLATKIISTPSVERILNNINFTLQGSAFNPAAGPSTQGGLFAFTIKHAGHRFYVLTSVFLNVTLAYDLDQKLWYLWTDASGNYWPILDVAFTQYNLSTGTATGGQHLGQRLSDGSVFIIDGADTYPNDAGQLFPVDIYTPNFDAGIDRIKTLNMMRFNADQTPGSLLKVRHSNDDYTTWSNFRTVDLNRERPILADEGSFYRRAYHFRHMSNTALRIKTVDLQLDIGVA